MSARAAIPDGAAGAASRLAADPCAAAIAREAFAPLAAAMAGRPALQAGLSANQLMLFIRGAMERLDWEIPRHDGPLRLSPDSRGLLAAHCGDIAAGLTALLTLPTAEPEQVEGGADV